MAKPSRAPVKPDRELASKILADSWALVLADDDCSVAPEITGLVNSNQVSIRFCLPTQLLGKLTDPELDILCLQKGNGSVGNWDPRGFATKVIVPWNHQNQKILGASSDPYVSNPLRRTRVDSGLAAMSDREQWEQLCAVLSEVQDRNDPDYARQVFFSVLGAIRNRLRELTFTYILPQRVSMAQAVKLVSAFLSEQSGGDRGLSVAAALFKTIQTRIGIYTDVRRGMINASDASTSAVADLECIGADGNIALAVEVKERQIGDADIKIAVTKAREAEVREFLLCTQGIRQSEQPGADKTISQAWASGTNLYHATIGELMQGVLPMLGEGGIHEFIDHIGEQLDDFATQPRHRKVWKALLDGM